jgi:hypothetical protein
VVLPDVAYFKNTTPCLTKHLCKYKIQWIVLIVAELLWRKPSSIFGWFTSICGTPLKQWCLLVNTKLNADFTREPCYFTFYKKSFNKVAYPMQWNAERKCPFYTYHVSTQFKTNGLTMSRYSEFKIYNKGLNTSCRFFAVPTLHMT